MNKYSYPFLIFPILLLLTCNTTEPDPNGKVTFTVEDISCTEAWLKLTGEPGSKLVLYRDEKEIMQINLSSADTIIYDDSLHPNKTYNYKLSNIGHAGSGIQVPATTMDTTSHNFTWETFTFGELASNELNDVAITDEDQIIAVGKYYMKDSTGQIDYNYYNAVYGEKNKLLIKRIPYYYEGQAYYHAIKSSFVFKGHYWFCGNGVIRSDGINFFEIPIPTSVWGSDQMNKIWGKNESNIYIAGANGCIAAYHNGTWKKIESGTDLYLSDIYGINEIYICGASVSTGGGIILKSNGDKFEKFAESKIVPEAKVFEPFLFGTIGSLWIDEKNALYVAGGLLYRYKSQKWDYMKALPGNKAYQNLNAEYRGYITGIRGNSSNDFWICGERNTLQHFNGVSWQQIGEPYNPQSEIIWNAIEVKGDIAVAVGSSGYKAIIMMIRKN